MAEYNASTPRELIIVAEEYAATRQQQREDAAIAAYLSAAWSRTKRLPKLDKVLEGIRQKPKQKAQTSEQMFAAVKALQRQYAGEEG